MVQDDGPVGLEGLKVEFDDERAVSSGRSKSKRTYQTAF